MTVWTICDNTAVCEERREYECDVFERLAELSAGRMVLLISHRFSTVKSASEILVLENGSIAERGTHDQVMRLGGIYHRLFTMQAARYPYGPKSEPLGLRLPLDSRS